MSDAKDDPASPICYLPEVEDGYAGYLTEPEVAALLRRWQRSAGSAEVAEQLAALLPSETAPDNSPSDDIAGGDIGELRSQILSALPRIRDDELHRRLRELAGSL